MRTWLLLLLLIGPALARPPLPVRVFAVPPNPEVWLISAAPARRLTPLLEQPGTVLLPAEDWTGRLTFELRRPGYRSLSVTLPANPETQAVRLPPEPDRVYRLEGLAAHPILLSDPPAATVRSPLARTVLGQAGQPLNLALGQLCGADGRVNLVLELPGFFPETVAWDVEELLQARSLGPVRLRARFPGAGAFAWLTLHPAVSAGLLGLSLLGALAALWLSWRGR